MRSQCPDRRIASQHRLKSEIAAWERQRNASRARIKCMFTTEKARAKMGAPTPAKAMLLRPRSKSHNHRAEDFTSGALPIRKVAPLV